MKCYTHNDADAVAQCNSCGKFLCKECADVYDPPLCPKCGMELASAQIDAYLAETARKQKGLLTYKEFEITDKNGKEKTVLFSPKGFIINAVFSLVGTLFLGAGTAADLEGAKKLLIIPLAVIIFSALWLIGKMTGYAVRKSATVIGVVGRFILIFLAIEIPLVIAAMIFNGLPAFLSYIVAIAVMALLVLLPVRDIKIALAYYKLLKGEQQS